MAGLVNVEIPVTLEAARLLRDAGRAERVGKLVSNMLRPANPGEDPLTGLIAEVKSEAIAAGLTDEQVEAELDAYNAERRL